ncbi:hypothetical protein V1L54_26360 [Streptomyces sp. TRM 70361]|nr:hypothetical protein [Streptomyces sp. TRM 70361]MEE1942889.1 hypothetical protein [Streptomyces sp. TRM 70361]
MSYRAEWRTPAKNRLIGFRKTDPDGVDQVFDAINALMSDPGPTGARQYG